VTTRPWKNPHPPRYINAQAGLNPRSICGDVQKTTKIYLCQMWPKSVQYPRRYARKTILNPTFEPVIMHILKRSGKQIHSAQLQTHRHTYAYGSEVVQNVFNEAWQPPPTKIYLCQMWPKSVQYLWRYARKTILNPSFEPVIICTYWRGLATKYIWHHFRPICIPMPRLKWIPAGSTKISRAQS
jgi:hypothetical protein